MTSLHHLSLARTTSLRIAIALTIALAATAIAAIACSSDEEPTPSPTATLTPAPSPTVQPTDTPAPEPTSSDIPQELAESPLATAFAEWGPTCLNGVYPSEAPALDDVPPEQYLDGANGIRYHVISQGEGAVPKPTWEVDVQYTGWLENGCIFDSSYTRSQPAVFPVNAVIPGWQITLTEMQVGERRRVQIPPQLAYGPDGNPPIIPADATLTFDIILISGTSGEAIDAAATQTAEDLFIQATQEAQTDNPDTDVLEPITVDYFEDVPGFLNAIPNGERSCMAAHAGGQDQLQAVFSAQQRAPGVAFLENIDGCLSPTTARNIVIGRILVVQPDLSQQTLQCMKENLKSPTLKPLFGVFTETEVSREWITTHFCMDTQERVSFHNSLYGQDPNRPPATEGNTFVDVQECMVQRLGADQYFAPVEPPDSNDSQAVAIFYDNFSTFLIADLHCQRGQQGSPLPDGTPITAEIAQCIVDDIGTTLFGETILGRTWIPTEEQFVQIVTSFSSCGAQTDLILLPNTTPALDQTQLTCLTQELSNSPDPAQTSLRAFIEIGQRSQIKPGDLVSLTFASVKCQIPLPGISQRAEISDEEVSCIVGKIDPTAYSQEPTAVINHFTQALAQSQDCTQN